ncbi:MAG TPA: CPBP family glutamic-type intramembrane protease [Pilimelia sp.]|nr:CPBP family glutamic-type intramembrane protease [Pilimelia sp.]
MNTSTEPASIRGLARRHPLGVFVAATIGLTWPVQIVSLANGWELMPALLLELAFLLGAATLITAWTDGRPGVRRLYAGALRWRIGLGRFVVLITAMPALALLVGAATGTLHTPPDGWASLLAPYLFQTLIFGLLLGNVWEETAWGGFLQARLMARHGLWTGSLLTAVPFVVMHLPLAFEQHGWHGTTWGQAALDWALIALVAPFFRYLLGTVLVDTAGSVLAIGLLHASFNGAGKLAALPGGWQYVPAVIVLTLLVAAYRRWRGRSLTEGSAPALLPAPAYA